MNVLSLFDGISVGQLALRNIGIIPDNYYASEIDKNAIAVTQKHFPNTIQIGDVQSINPDDLLKIDILFGGFPCQDFSMAGKQAGLSGQRGGLFFELLRVFRAVKPKYFLFENVVMQPEILRYISSEIGIEPVLIDSSKFSAQHRKRFYWTNINFSKTYPNSNETVRDILEHSNLDQCRVFSNPDFKTPKAHFPTKKIATIGNYQGDRIFSLDGKSCTLIAAGGGKCGQTGLYAFNIQDNIIHSRKLTPIEAERLQTLPDNYTEGFSNTARFHMIGNSWTVRVIEHILSGILSDPRPLSTNISSYN